MLVGHLESFATEGLRTLCCAVAELDRSDYEDWKAIFHKAACAIEDRESTINA